MAKIEEPGPGIALLFSEIDSDVAQEICQWIITENMSARPPPILTMMINSPGGDLPAAFAIIEMMNASNIPVRTVGMGETLSAGLIIAMSGTPGHRVITPTCSVMSHNFSTSAAGTYAELKLGQRELDRVSDRIIAQYKKCTGLDDKIIKSKLVSSKDMYFDANEAVKLNLFDIVSDVKHLNLGCKRK